MHDREHMTFGWYFLWFAFWALCRNLEKASFCGPFKRRMFLSRTAAEADNLAKVPENQRLAMEMTLRRRDVLTRYLRPVRFEDDSVAERI